MHERVFMSTSLFVHSRPSKCFRPDAMHVCGIEDSWGLVVPLVGTSFRSYLLCLHSPIEPLIRISTRRDRAKQLQSQDTGFAHIERPQMIKRIERSRLYILAILLLLSATNALAQVSTGTI